MKTKIALIATTALLIGCSSVSDSIPTVKIEKRKPKTTVQSAAYSAPSSAYVVQSGTPSTSATPKEAATVCETNTMRSKVVDGNDNNDSVRIMVVQDSDGSSQLLSEIEINCRDYFLRKNVRASEPAIVRTSVPSLDRDLETRHTTSSRYTYIVQKGDTVWDIAREHCTTVKAVSRLNGLGRGNVLDIGQRLKLPDEEC